MNIDIILKEDIKGLGEKDDIVKVRAGYGRNFLIPTGKGLQATESNRKVLAENLKQAAFKQDKIQKVAEATAEALKEVKLTIGAKAGETGKIFGAVTPLQLSETLAKLGHEVDRRKITFDTDVKEIGTYTANLNLHKSVKLKVEFEVVAE